MCKRFLLVYKKHYSERILFIPNNVFVFVYTPQDDYFVTGDQSWVPLRWIAPELVDEVHGNLLVADQTKQSNIW